jgi:hypothetical protein
MCVSSDRSSAVPFREMRSDAPRRTERSAMNGSDGAAMWDRRYSEAAGRPTQSPVVRLVAPLAVAWAVDLGSGAGPHAIWPAQRVGR